MLLEAILLSLLVGLIRRGSIKRLGQLDLRHTWLIFTPAALMGLMFIPAIGKADTLASVIHYAAYLVVLVVIFANRHLPGMALIGLGAALNFAAITANGGRMPVSIDAARIGHMEKQLRDSMARQSRHSLVDENTRLRFLSDVIPLPRLPIGGKSKTAQVIGNLFGGVMSVGDGILAIGLFLLIQHGVCPRKREKELIPATDSG